MILRADHVAGAAFIGFGLLVFALSGDLPMGRLSMPGAGFMPSLVATLLIVFGAALFARAGDSTPFSQLSWDDLSHAALVIAVTACAIALYTAAGFLITVAGMLFVF